MTSQGGQLSPKMSEQDSRIFFFFFVFEREGKKESVYERGRRAEGGEEGKERERESLVGSILNAEPDVGLHPTTLGS